VSLVSTSRLAKRFGDLEVLRSVSVTVEEGELVGLLGPSGCGKTTLLRILLGLETYDAGHVSAPLGRAGYLPQEGLLLPWKTVLGNAVLPLEVQGVAPAERRSRARELLPAFGLEGFEKSYPHEISGGMRQRAALLRAVLTGSPALVLDEPFGALDTLTRHRLQDWLADLARRLGRTVLFVTHDLEEAVVLSERVIVLSPRPAVVLGEEAIALSLGERHDRLGRVFLSARDRLLGRLQEGWT
jgi:ABC-type nitrate/sulfonate/bicarbonate transport system ATPase subunit